MTTTPFRTLIKPYTEIPISRSLLLQLLKKYKDPNDKISQLLKSGALVSLRRGMYVVGSKLDLPTPNKFLIANHLRGPSYVSLEAALSYWGMIPENVFEISSVTTKSYKTFKNAIGRFSFQKMNTSYFSYGITNVVVSAKQSFLMASKEKALCDKIVVSPNLILRSVKQTKAYLIEDLRIDLEILQILDTKKMELWIEHAPKKSSLKVLIKTLHQL